MTEEERIMCDSCEAVTINGVLCHEHGCPDAWKDSIVECWNCGSSFQPEFKGQHFCDDDCHNAYYGVEDTEEYTDE